MASANNRWIECHRFLTWLPTACCSNHSVTDTRRAVIDVGTNSVKLLVADVAGHDVRPIWEDSKQTRLGAGFYETHRLQIEPIAYSANAVADFARVARQNGAASIRVIATSAARDAANPEDLTAAIQVASGLKVEIISGDREAEWAFRGITAVPDLADRHLLLLDVGGGSVQFILGQGEHMHFRRSFPLGAVRLLEKFPHSDPPKAQEFNSCRAWVGQFLADEVRPALEPALSREEGQPPTPKGRIELVGTGGTASILARIEAQLEEFDRAGIEATRLSLPGIRTHRQQLWNMPLDARKKITGLPKKRADVILTGVVIYEAVMEEFGFNELRVSTRGLRFAALMDEA